MKYIMIFLVWTSVFAQNVQNYKMPGKFDGFIVHSPEYPRQTINQPLEIFDNEELKGAPLYIIDTEKVIDFSKGKNEYRFKEYYKMKNGTSDNFELAYINIKKFPVDMIKSVMAGYVIPIEEKKGDIYKVFGKKLFFKIGQNNLKGELKHAMDWKNDYSIDAVKIVLEEDKDFKNFMESFKKCVDLKDVQCLFRLNPKFKGAIERWTVQSDKASCDKMNNGESVKFSGQDYVVDWELYRRFLTLNDPEMKSLHVISEFGNESRLTLDLMGDSACGPRLKILIEVNRSKGKKTEIEVFPYPGEA